MILNLLWVGMLDGIKLIHNELYQLKCQITHILLSEIILKSKCSSSLQKMHILYINTCKYLHTRDRFNFSVVESKLKLLLQIKKYSVLSVIIIQGFSPGQCEGLAAKKTTPKKKTHEWDFDGDKCASKNDHAQYCCVCIESMLAAWVDSVSSIFITNRIDAGSWCIPAFTHKIKVACMLLCNTEPKQAGKCIFEFIKILCKLWSCILRQCRIHI